MVQEQKQTLISSKVGVCAAHSEQEGEAGFHLRSCLLRPQWGPHASAGPDQEFFCVINTKSLVVSCRHGLGYRFEVPVGGSEAANKVWAFGTDNNIPQGGGGQRINQLKS